MLQLEYNILNKAFDSGNWDSYYNIVRSYPNFSHVPIKTHTDQAKAKMCETNDDKKLMSISLKEKPGKNRRLIDLKGKGGIDFNKLENSDTSIFGPITKDPRTSMRAFVNRKLASKDSVFNALIEVMNKYSDEFASALLNLVLKAKLFEFLDKSTFA